MTAVSTQQGCWLFAVSCCSIILIITTIVYVPVVCGISSKTEPISIYISSILCVTFGLFCNILLLTTYPVCHLYTNCGENLIGDFYFITIFDSYLLNKIFVFLAIIYRLFDTFYGTSHKYGKRISVILYLLLFLIFIIFLSLNISVFFDFPSQSIKPKFFTSISILIYIVINILLSIFITYLYIKPLSTLIIEQIQSQKYSMSQDVINSIDFRRIQSIHKNKESSSSIWDGSHQPTSDYVQQTDWDFGNKTIFIMIKFLVLIIFAIISNIIFGLIFVIRFNKGNKGWYHATDKLSDCFLDILAIFHMIEILINCIVVYLNFKSANNIYIRLCKKCHFKGFNCMKKTIKRSLRRLFEDESSVNNRNKKDHSGKSAKSNLLSDTSNPQYKILVPSYATQDLNI